MLDQFATTKPAIGMVHLPATPGTPRHDASRSIEEIIADVRRDVDHLVAGGVDGLLFCNEDDRPYRFELGAETVAFMTRVVSATAPHDRPYGVDVLWDAKAALAIAAATGASFIREVVCGTYESDMGLWSPDPGEIWGHRRHIAAEHVQIWANIQPEFASPLGSRNVAERARSVLVSCVPDALLVSGPMAGQAPDRRLLEETREAIPDDVPLVINTGARPDTVTDFLKTADAVIVGTALKVDGDTWGPIDGDRVRVFMERVQAVR